MSSTTGVQNFLVNVFRPVYTYDPIASLYTAKLELSNIDAYSGNTISVITAAVGDTTNSNVYVGLDAGNLFTTPRACNNVVALGYGAGKLISNVSNSTYLGNAAGAGAVDASSVIGIGTSAGGNGISNIFIGNSTSATGNNNILIGHGISGITSNTLRLGSTVYGDLATNWVGIGRSTPYDSNDKLDVSGNVYVLGQMGINTAPGERTLDVDGDFRASDGSGNVLEAKNGIVTSTKGFTSVQGSVTVSNSTGVSIGTLQKGLMMIAVSSGTTQFDGRTSFVLDVNTPTVSNLSSNKSGNTTVLFGSNSVEIYNGTFGILTYDYCITYFPLP